MYSEIFTTDRLFELKFNTLLLPHMLGMNYAYGVDKEGNPLQNKSEYSPKGIIDKIKKREITYDDFVSRIYSRTCLPVSPEQIINRAPLIKQFFDNISSGKCEFGVIDRSKLTPKETFKGNCFLHQKIDGEEPIYLIMVLKKDDNPNNSENFIFESFRLEYTRAFIDRFDSENIIAVSKMSPVKNREDKVGYKSKKMGGRFLLQKDKSTTNIK